jgi:hypothetical protein
MKFPIFVIATSVASSPALAQTQLGDPIDRWAAEKQVYVTKLARQEVLDRVLGGALAETTQGRPPPRISTWLERFPTIRLIVQPAPPRDYSVAINGEFCPPTERGLYKVPAGPVEVRVTRGAKPPCVWSGNLADGLTQEVPCAL